MCGLVGLLTKTDNGPAMDEYNAFGQMMVVNNLRGSDSTGIGYVGKDDAIAYRKQIGTVWDLWKSTNWKEFDQEAYRNAKFLLGHGRSATRGTVTVDNAHPFIVKENEHQIMLVHNGTLNEYQQLPDFNKYPVDSLWMAHMLSTKDKVEVLSKIYGAIATMWYDSKEGLLNIYRNMHRPLFWVTMPNGSILINSERAAISWICQRLNINIEYKNIVPFEENILYTFDKDLNMEQKKVERVYATTYQYDRHGWFRDAEYAPFFGTNCSERSTAVGSTTKRSEEDDEVNVVNETYWVLKNNTLMRRLYLDLFSGRAEWAEFGHYGAKVKYQNSKNEVTYPNVHSAKFEIIRVKHNRPDEIIEEHIRSGENIYVHMLFEEIFENVPKKEIKPIVPLGKKGIKYVVGRRFKPNSKVRFNWVYKETKRKKKSAKNWGITGDSKFLFQAYGNELDGNFYVGGLVAFEPFEVVNIAKGDKPLWKVQGVTLDTHGDSLVTIEWYTQEFTKEEIFSAGLFVGAIGTLRVSTDEESKIYDDVVRIIVRNVRAFDSLTDEDLKQHERDNQIPWEVLVEEIDGKKKIETEEITEEMEADE